MRRLVRLSLFVASATCFVVFVSVHQDSTSTETMKIDTTAVGFPGSPWLMLTQTSTEKTEGMSFSASVSSNFRINFVSWSSLVLIAAVALLVAARRLRRHAAPVDAVDVVRS